MGKRNKKYNALAHSRKRAVGLIVSWSDKSPHMDSEGFMPGSVKHRNPTLSPVAGPLYARLKDWLVNEQPFFWKIELTVVFKYPNQVDQRETREMFAYCVLAELEAMSVEQFRDAKRHGAEEQYSHTEFVVECLSSNPCYRPIENVAQSTNQGVSINV